MSEHASAEPAEAGARPAYGFGGLLAPIRRFRRDAEGATAIEFALVSVPFLALIFAIIETALTFLTTQVLETAVEFASRQIYTGQFQRANEATPAPTAGELGNRFKAEFCKKFIGLTPCASVRIDVQAYTTNTFPSTLPNPITTNAQGERVVDPNFGQFNSPSGNQIVVVRAVVENPVFVSLLNPNQANLSNGKRLIVGTAAFRTEPFN